MSEPLSKIPGGMRYYFGAEARLRRTVEDTAMAVFSGWSYEELTTPTADYYALFEQGMGRREAHRAFRFTDTDGLMLALRPDVTSSVARAAATLFAERQRPLRLCYAASVFRQQSQSHAQWRREQAQTGCELIGAGEEVADMEVLAIACEVLQRLGLGGKYSITLNNVEIFNGIAERLSLDSDLRDEMRQLMDTRNGADLERFLIPYTSMYTSMEERRAFARLTHLSGKRSTLDQALPFITNPRSWLWHKGETSGHTQRVLEILVDCDRDALVVLVEPSGPACHTGARACFNDLIEDAGDGGQLRGEPKDLGEVLRQLYQLIETRKLERPQGSYTTYLFDAGLDKILKKVGEEASETIIAAKNEDRLALTKESADLLYHLLVLMVERGVTLHDIGDELLQRKGKGR